MKAAFAIAAALVFLSLPPVGAAVCVTSGSGNWSDPAIWSDCGGQLPGPADSALVAAGNTVNYDVVTQLGDTVSSLTIDGALVFQPGRHRLQVRDLIRINGSLTVANGATIAFSSDVLSRVLNYGEFVSDNVSGLAVDDLIPLGSIVETAMDPQCVTGPSWALGIGQASTVDPGGLVQFADGGAQGRMYEVVGVGPSEIFVCPELPDSASVGARLTPHAPTSAVQQLPGSPYPEPSPQVGDQFWAWNPWRIEAVGAVGWGMLESESTPGTGRLEWIGGDLSNYDNPIVIVCDAARPPVILSHNNFHDHTQRIVLEGGDSPGSACDRPNVTWNVIHDGTVPNFHAHMGFLPEEAPVTGGVVAWNTFYRTSHNTLQINAVGIDAPLIGFDISYNTGFDLGTSASGECEFIEIDVVRDSVVQFNRAWRVSRGCGGIVAKPQTAPELFSGNLVRFNYIQGAHRGIQLSTSGNLYAGNHVIGNYVADVHTLGISAFAANYNIVNRWSDGNYANGNSLLYAIESHVAEGNLLDGGLVDRAVIGIKSDNDANAAGVVRRFRNNVCRRFGTGQFFGASCIFIQDGTAAFDVEIEHNVADCGWLTDCDGVAHLRSGWAPTGPSSARVADNVTFGIGAGSRPAVSNSAVEVSDMLLQLTRWPQTADPAAGNWEVVTGEVARDPQFVDPDADWNYLPGSSEPGAGSTPPGSAMGVRSRLFPAELFPQFLRDVMQVPVDTINDTLSDTDGDGAYDAADNCADLANAAQFDPDGDGRGRLCDVCPLVPDLLQGDIDGDGEGDACDPDDSRLWLRLEPGDTLGWDMESVADEFNVYRGSLGTLRQTGVYTQDPLVEPLVEQICELSTTTVVNVPTLQSGEAVFYLVTWEDDGVESDPGNSSVGTPRPNDNPCD